jgi:hypothetical protein
MVCASAALAEWVRGLAPISAISLLSRASLRCNQGLEIRGSRPFYQRDNHTPHSRHACTGGGGQLSSWRQIASEKASLSPSDGTVWCRLHQLWSHEFLRLEGLLPMLLWSVISTHKSRISMATDISVAIDTFTSKPAKDTIARAHSTCGAPNTTASNAPRRLSPINYKENYMLTQNAHIQSWVLTQRPRKMNRILDTLTMGSPIAR